MVRFTDAEISDLLEEPKQLPADYERSLQVQQKRTAKQASLDVMGDNGHEFRIILRQSRLNAMDFSAILAHVPADSHTAFRLRRYNGKTGEHTNSLERERMDGFHIHFATQRYQEHGQAEDAYAEPTSRYATLGDAVECLLDDCGFVRPPQEQLSLFSEGV
ncbi:MAG: hypothetical protein ABFE08_16115 [Armatimonadia bacterium]